MADAKNIVNTRIVLRNDTLEHWQSSTNVLLKGEVALASLPGDLSAAYQMRIGTGNKTWNDLEPSNIIIPSQNISCLTYDEYSLSSRSADEGYSAVFQLYGKESKSQEWKPIGTELSIPEADFTDVDNKISALSAEVSAISATHSNLSSTTLDEAKKYTNNVSATLSTDYQEQINTIKGDIAGGIHFIGHVVEFGKDESGKCWYKLNESDDETVAKNGDLIIKDDKEYICSATQKKWDEFGDEGNYATKDFVNDAISRVGNTVHQETDLTDEAVAGYLSADSTKVIGDVLINKVSIDDKAEKHQYTAYVWDGTAWTAMDGNYSAENVYFKDDIKLAGSYTTVGNVNLNDGTLKSAGKSVKDVMTSIFTKELNPVPTLPTATVTTTATLTGEAGATYTVPAATLKFTGVGSYTYGPSTGISCLAGNAKLSCVEEGQSDTNASDLVLNGTVSLAAGTANAKVFTDSTETYNYKGSLTYTDGAMPKTNLGNDCPSAQIKSATLTPSATSRATGYRRRFWYIGTDCTTTIDNDFIRSSSTGHGSDFSTTTKTKDLAVAAGTKRVMFAYKGAATLKSVIDVDGMGLDIKDKFTSMTVSVEGANGYAAVSYTVFVFENPSGVTATTMKITLN